MDPPRATLSAWTIPNTTLVAVDGAGLKPLMDDDCTIGYYVMKRLLYLVTSKPMATRNAVTIEQSAEMSRQGPIVAAVPYQRVSKGNVALEHTKGR